MFFFRNESMDLIIILSEDSEGIGHLLLFFVTSFPGWYEIVRFKKGALFDICGSNIQSILIKHDSLALHGRGLTVLSNIKHIRKLLLRIPYL